MTRNLTNILVTVAIGSFATQAFADFDDDFTDPNAMDNYNKFVLAEDSPTYQGEPYFTAIFSHNPTAGQVTIEIDTTSAFNFARLTRNDQTFDVNADPAGIAVWTWAYGPQLFFTPGNKVQSPLIIGIVDPDTGDSLQLQMQWLAGGGLGNRTGYRIQGNGTELTTGETSVAPWSVPYQLQMNATDYTLLIDDVPVISGPHGMDTTGFDNATVFMQQQVTWTYGGADPFHVGTFNSFGAAHLTTGGGLTGDLDGDGFVGISDLNIVLGNWNQNVPPADPAADPSGDGFVGINDLNEVLSNWNAGTPPTADAAVPEPASLALIGLGGLALSRRQR